MATATHADPTMELLERLRHEDLWDIHRAVPVFCPHERQGKDGKPIKVNVERLRRIVANARKLKNSRAVVPRITIGHIRPEAREEDQPDFVGFADNWRLGKFGPEKIDCILVDCYYEKACRKKLRTPDGRAVYPYRSAEFYPPSDEITGVALLKRDPQLDMGLTYERHGERGGTYFYVMGDEDMPPPMTDPTKPPMAAPPGSAGKPGMPPVKPGLEDDQEPEGHEEWKAHMDHYRKKDPVMKYMCSKYEKEGMGSDSEDGQGDDQGSKNDMKGPEPDPDAGGADKYNRSVTSEEYVRMKARVAQIERERAEEKKAYNRSQAKLVMEEFDRERIIIDDRKEMLQDLMNTDDAGRLKIKAKVLTNYQRDPTGDNFLPIAEDEEPATGGEYPAARREPEFNERDLAEAQEYMRKNAGKGLSHEEMWDKAQEYAIQQRGKRKR